MFLAIIVKVSKSFISLKESFFEQFLWTLDDFLQVTLIVIDKLALVSDTNITVTAEASLGGCHCLHSIIILMYF